MAKKEGNDGKKKRRYKIQILPERCKGCRLCVAYCPEDVFMMSDKVNIKGNFFPIIVDQNKCKGCRLCFKMCPDFAIYVEDKN